MARAAKWIDNGRQIIEGHFDDSSRVMERIEGEPNLVIIGTDMNIRMYER